MRLLLSIGAVIALGLALASCDAYIENLEHPIDRIPSDVLNSPEQVPFLITGVQQRHAQSHMNLGVQAGLLSDQFRFCHGVVVGCTFPTYRQLAQETPLLINNTSVRGLWVLQSQHRSLADELIDRVENRITFGPGQETLRQEGLFHGYLHAGLSRLNLAAFWGIDQTTGGAVINAGPFMPSAELYAEAVSRFQTALTHSPSAYLTRVTNSLLARTHLYAGNYQQARAAAQNGMQQGDPSWDALYSTRTPNYWFSASGPGRVQAVVMPRFENSGDPRAPVARAPMTAAAAALGLQMFRQARYNAQETPKPVINWQENHLMLAELALRLDGAAGTVTALTLVNEARASYGMAPVALVDMGVIERERDFTLFTQAQRLVDQRRFGSWHLPAGTWQYLPIPDSERLTNPHID